MPRHLRRPPYPVHQNRERASFQTLSTPEAPAPAPATYLYPWPFDAHQTKHLEFLRRLVEQGRLTEYPEEAPR
jgi:hypothetical protein